MRKEKQLLFGAECSILDTVSSPIEHGPHTGKGETRIDGRYSLAYSVGNLSRKRKTPLRANRTYAQVFGFAEINKLGVA